MSRYRFIDGQRATHPVRLLCHGLRYRPAGITPGNTRSNKTPRPASRLGKRRW